jgi:hypothetical protein
LEFKSTTFYIFSELNWQNNYRRRRLWEYIKTNLSNLDIWIFGKPIFLNPEKLYFGGSYLTFKSRPHRFYLSFKHYFYEIQDLP